MKIRVGDVVVLRGQRVTINDVFGNSAECVWFDDNNHLHKEVVSVAHLKVG